MSGWQILAWCAVCASGLLVFLVPVAGEIEVTTEYLRLLREVEEKANSRRQAAEAEAETVARSVA